MSIMKSHVEKLQYIFDNAKVGIAICNAQNNTLEMVNPAFAHLHGYEPHELIGVSPSKVFAPDCMVRLEEHERGPSCAVNDVAFETTHIRKDGSQFPVSVHITVVKDADGALIHRIANVQDITERQALRESNKVYTELFDKTVAPMKHYLSETDAGKTFDPQKMSSLLLSGMLKKLNASEREMRSLANNISDYLVRYDREGRFVYMNQSLKSLLGVSLSAIRGKKTTDIPGLPDAELFEQTVLRVVETGVAESFLHELRGHDGAERFGLVNATPELDEEGNVQYVQILTRDITGHKQMENALHEANDRYTKILDNSIDVIYLIDVTPEGRFIHLDINAAFVETIGLPREAIVGRYVDEIEDNEFRNILTDKYTSCLTKEGKTDYIAEYNLPSGIRTFHSTLSPIFDENGRIHRIVGVARDITDAKRDEEELIKTKIQLTSLISTIPDLIWVKNQEGAYLTCNPSLERFFGMPKSEIVGKTDYDYMDSDTADLCKQSDLDAINAGTVTLSYETFLYPDTGTEGILEIRKFPIFMPGGESMGILGIARDITEQKQLELALKENQTRLETIIENEPECIKIIDGEGRLVYMNPAGLDMIEATLEQVQGKEVLGVIVEEYRDPFVQMHRRVIAGEKVHLIFETIGLKGKHCWLETTSAPMQMDGKTVLLGVTRDITERKQAEEALEIREREFRTLAENTPDNIARWDCEGRYLYINPVHERTLGKSAAEVIGTFIPDSHEAVKAAIAQVAATGENIMVRQSAPNEKGEIEVHDVNIVAEKDPSGKIISVLGIGRDITELKRIETALENREQSLNEAQRIAHVGSWDVDILNDVLTWSDETYRMWEIDKERFEATIEAFLETVHPEDRELVAKTYNDAIINRSHYDVEHRLLFPDGRIKYIHERGEPHYDTAGKPIRFIGTALDITERKKQEELLHQKEAEFRSLSENSPDPIFRYDRECRRFYVNTAMERLCGIPISKLLGMTPSEETIFPMQEALRLEEAIQKVVRTGEPEMIDLLFIAPDGKKYYYQNNHIPEFGPDGTIVSVLAISHDITAQKRLIDEYNEREQMFRTLAETSPNIIMRYDLECRRIYVNPAFAKHTGIPVEEAINTKPSEKWNMNMLHTSAVEYQDKIKHVIESGEPNRFTAEWYTLTDGSYSVLDLQIVAQKDTQGEIIGALAVGHDITERKLMEKQLLEQNRFLESILNAIPVPIFLKDKETRYKGFNKAFEEFYGKNKADLIGKGVFDLFPHDQAQIFFDADTDLFRNGGTQIYEAKLQNARGVDHAVMFHKAIYFDEAGEAMGQIGTILDITERKQQEERLQKTKAKLSAVISTIPDMIWVKDENGVYMMCNPAFERFFGAPTDEIIGKTDYDFISIEEADYCKKTDIEAIHTNSISLSQETITYQEDGSTGIMEVRKVPVYNDDDFMGVLGIARDITESKRLEQEIQHNEKRLKEAQKIANIGNWELEFPGLKLHWSDEVYRIFELSPGDWEPSYDHLLNIVHPDERVMVDIQYLASIENKIPYDVTYRILLNEDTIKYVHEKGETFYDTQGKPLRSVGTLQDITKQKRIEKKIEHMAHHDALTGLPNRILAQDRTEQAIAHAKRKNRKIALLYVDLDEFKTINDSLGHSVGDETLKLIASRLKACVRESDTICRQGGDEFLLILSDIEEENDVAVIADKLLKKFGEPLPIGEHILNTSTSIGIALYPEHGETFESLLKNADAAMYKAKESGKNNYCFYTEQMNHNLVGLFKMRNDLRSALEYNEFVLHYQPQIDLSENKIVGAEALIRWCHPQLGMIPPMSFIPIAESSGLIVQIGQWVIEEACRQALLWHERGMEITVAVNISAVQFKRGNLETVVKEALESSGLNPRFLELELTESILITDVENILKTVQALKALGIQLSIDDFGTGYSSLAYLKRFAVDKLKIDQSFVRDILKDQEDAAIVQTIIQMAKNLNLKTIAEGVEDASVLSVIDAYGCDEVQGYHFAKPMESTEFETYYHQYQNEVID